MLDFEDDGLLHPLVYNGTTPDERKQFETKLYLRYKYSLSHYLRFFRDIRKRLALPVTLSFNVARHSWAKPCPQTRYSSLSDQRRTGAYFRKDHPDLPRRT